MIIFTRIINLKKINQLNYPQNNQSESSDFKGKK